MSTSELNVIDLMNSEAKLREINAAMLEALQNMIGVFDSPVRRRKMPGWFEDEAVASARAALAKAAIGADGLLQP